MRGSREHRYQVFVSWTGNLGGGTSEEFADGAVLSRVETPKRDSHNWHLETPLLA